MEVYSLHVFLQGMNRGAGTGGRCRQEILLQEVHHRIKNHMSIVMNLLSLQAASIKGSPAVASLEEAKARVQSLQVLYDKLYCSSDFRTVSTKAYLTSLVDEIMGNFPCHQKVKIGKDIHECLLDVKKLAPPGIIVNELITNAIKNAFTGREEGLLRVTFMVEGRQAILTIQDDGSVLSESESLPTGFGMRLLEALSGQIQGEIRFNRERGTEFILQFDIEVPL